MKTRMFRIVVPTILGIICILLGIGFSFILANPTEEEKINYISCKREEEADDYTLAEEYRIYMDDHDYLETIYYYDDEITPTVYTDYVRSLEDNAFQCND